MDTSEKRKEMRTRRHARVRSKVIGSATRPRFAVFKSHQHIYVQCIDDEAKKTIFSVSDMKLSAAMKKTSGIERAKEVGKLVAQAALEKGIKEGVFDRSGFTYHGNIKAVADGAREAGLKF